MSEYIETTVTLDHLQILNLIGLTKRRIDELEATKVEGGNAWFIVNLADEQIGIHKQALKILEAADKEIRAIAKKNHDEYMANLGSKSKKRSVA